MASFKDANGKEWVVHFDVTTLSRIKRDTGLDPFDPEQLQRVLADTVPVTLCNALYVACENEAKKLGVSDEDFGRLLFGDVLASATKAFADALVDFTPDPRQRATMRKALGMIDKAKEYAMTKADAELTEEKLKARVDEAMEQMTKPLSGSTSSDLPEPSGSTPALEL